MKDAKYLCPFVFIRVYSWFASLISEAAAFPESPRHAHHLTPE